MNIQMSHCMSDCLSRTCTSDPLEYICNVLATIKIVQINFGNCFLRGVIYYFVSHLSKPSFGCCFVSFMRTTVWRCLAYTHSASGSRTSIGLFLILYDCMCISFSPEFWKDKIHSKGEKKQKKNVFRNCIEPAIMTVLGVGVLPTPPILTYSIINLSRYCAIGKEPILMGVEPKTLLLDILRTVIYN